MSDIQFLYVYDRNLVKFLRYEKKLLYNCTGLNVKTSRQFYQFNKSKELLSAFDEYQKLKIKVTL